MLTIKQHLGYCCQRTVEIFLQKTILEKIEAVERAFQSLSSEEEKYQILIEMGRQKRTSFLESWKTEENLVPGCQSELWLAFEKKGEKIFYYAHSEALISAGLAALLIGVYSE